jgi:hypothetical protein
MTKLCETARALAVAVLMSILSVGGTLALFDIAGADANPDVASFSGIHRLA